MSPAGGSLCFQLAASRPDSQAQTVWWQDLLIVSDGNIVCGTRFIVSQNTRFVAESSPTAIVQAA
jgi:hypothetical protein